MTVSTYRNDLFQRHNETSIYLFPLVSLPADFLVWVASPKAAFLHGKLVFAAWDVDELKEREKEIFNGGKPGGDLSFGIKGFPRYVNGNAAF